MTRTLIGEWTLHLISFIFLQELSLRWLIIFDGAEKWAFGGRLHGKQLSIGYCRPVQRNGGQFARFPSTETIQLLFNQSTIGDGTKAQSGLVESETNTALAKNGNVRWIYTSFTASPSALSHPMPVPKIQQSSPGWSWLMLSIDPDMSVGMLTDASQPWNTRGVAAQWAKPWTRESLRWQWNAADHFFSQTEVMKSGHIETKCPSFH
jgi:hypothetical protein